MKSYKELVVWQKSMELVVLVYNITNTFPNGERFGLVSQMRRSAVSIPSNIAEGYGRKSKKENAYFVNVAYGSATELDTQVIISHRLKFIKQSEMSSVGSTLSQVQKMLYSYRRSLRR